MKKVNIYDIIMVAMSVIFLVLSTFLIYMLIMKLIGHSPDKVTFITWATGIIVGFQAIMVPALFSIYNRIGRLMEFRNNTIERFRAVDHRLNEFRGDMLDKFRESDIKLEYFKKEVLNKLTVIEKALRKKNISI